MSSAEPALFNPQFTPRSAVLSPCGRYRYVLTRRWAAEPGPVCVIVALNPSTADAEHDDPTVKRCIGFARRCGATELRIVNLYALRATDPGELWSAEDPVGPDNDRHLVAAAEVAVRTVGPIIVAWGANARSDRVRAGVALLGRKDLLCLGTTKAGAPRHPLYLPATAPLMPWTHRANAG